MFTPFVIVLSTLIKNSIKVAQLVLTERAFLDWASFIWSMYQQEKERKKMKKKEKENNKGRVQFQGYLNYKLTKSDKETVREYAAIDGNFHQFLSEVMDMGYKVSFSFSESAGANVCSAYGMRHDNPNAGYVFSQLHIDMNVCMAAVWFVIVNVFDGGEWVRDDEDWVDW